eukprot:COSAG02_NODE_24763_length_678_cov_1.072539_1_plen_33_part_01
MHHLEGYTKLSVTALPRCRPQAVVVAARRKPGL